MRRLSRTFQFKDFPAAIKFVNAVAELAEKAWHHPDIDIRWNKVTLTLTTHDAGGLTEKDFVLARKFDELSLRVNSPNFSCRRLVAGMVGGGVPAGGGARQCARSRCR